MLRFQPRERQLYDYIKENVEKTYSITALQKILDMTYEEMHRNLVTLRFADQMEHVMDDDDTFRVIFIANAFEDGQEDLTEKRWRQHTKKLVKIYKEQGYSPEQCSEISDVEIETVNKYWGK